MHSYRAKPTGDNEDWVMATTSYGDDFVSVVEKGNVSATQFHPEKSGQAGLDVLRAFLEGESNQDPVPANKGIFPPHLLLLNGLCAQGNLEGNHFISLSCKMGMLNPTS